MPSTSIVPPVGRIEPESTPNSSSWPWPSSATTPSDLAGAEVEGDVVELGADAEVAHARAAAARSAAAASRRRRGAAALGLVDPGAEHQLDDPLLGAGRHVDDADGLAVAEHRGAVAERGNLEEAGAR